MLQRCSSRLATFDQQQALIGCTCTLSGGRERTHRIVPSRSRILLPEGSRTWLWHGPRRMNLGIDGFSDGVQSQNKVPTNGAELDCPARAKRSRPNFCSLSFSSLSLSPLSLFRARKIVHDGHSHLSMWPWQLPHSRFPKRNEIKVVSHPGRVYPTLNAKTHLRKQVGQDTIPRLSPCLSPTLGI